MKERHTERAADSWTEEELARMDQVEAGDVTPVPATDSDPNSTTAPGFTSEYLADHHDESEHISFEDAVRVLESFRSPQERARTPQPTGDRGPVRDSGEFASTSVEIQVEEFVESLEAAQGRSERSHDAQRSASLVTEPVADTADEVTTTNTIEIEAADVVEIASEIDEHHLVMAAGALVESELSQSPAAVPPPIPRAASAANAPIEADADDFEELDESDVEEVLLEEAFAIEESREVEAVEADAEAEAEIEWLDSAPADEADAAEGVGAEEAAEELVETEVVEAEAAEELVEADAAEELVEADAAEELVEADAAEELVEADAADELVEADAADETVADADADAAEDVATEVVETEAVETEAVETEVVEADAATEAVETEAVETEVVEADAVDTSSANARPGRFIPEVEPIEYAGDEAGISEEDLPEVTPLETQERAAEAPPLASATSDLEFDSQPVEPAEERREDRSLHAIWDPRWSGMQLFSLPPYMHFLADLQIASEPLAEGRATGKLAIQLARSGSEGKRVLFVADEPSGQGDWALVFESGTELSAWSTNPRRSLVAFLVRIRKLTEEQATAIHATTDMKRCSERAALEELGIVSDHILRRSLYAHTRILAEALNNSPAVRFRMFEVSGPFDGLPPYGEAPPETEVEEVEGPRRAAEDSDDTKSVASSAASPSQPPETPDRMPAAPAKPWRRSPTVEVYLNSDDVALAKLASEITTRGSRIGVVDHFAFLSIPFSATGAEVEEAVADLRRRLAPEHVKELPQADRKLAHDVVNWALHIRDAFTSLVERRAYRRAHFDQRRIDDGTAALVHEVRRALDAQETEAAATAWARLEEIDPTRSAALRQELAEVIA